MSEQRTTRLELVAVVGKESSSHHHPLHLLLTNLTNYPLQVVHHVWTGSLQLLGTAISNVFFDNVNGSSGACFLSLKEQQQQQQQRTAVEEKDEGKTAIEIQPQQQQPTWMKLWERDIMILPPPSTRNHLGFHTSDDAPPYHDCDDDHDNNDIDNHDDWEEHHVPVPREVVTPRSHQQPHAQSSLVAAIDTSFLTFDGYIEEDDSGYKDDNRRTEIIQQQDEEDQSSTVYWDNPLMEYAASVLPDPLDQEDEDDANWEPIDWGKTEYKNNSSPLPLAVYIGGGTGASTTREDDCWSATAAEDATFLT